MNRIQELQARLDWMRENHLRVRSWAILLLADEIMEELRVAAGLPPREGE